RPAFAPAAGRPRARAGTARGAGGDGGLRDHLETRLRRAAEPPDGGVRLPRSRALALRELWRAPALRAPVLLSRGRARERARLRSLFARAGRRGARRGAVADGVAARGHALARRLRLEGRRERHTLGGGLSGLVLSRASARFPDGDARGRPPAPDRGAR